MTFPLRFRTLGQLRTHLATCKLPGDTPLYVPDASGSLQSPYLVTYSECEDPHTPGDPDLFLTFESGPFAYGQDFGELS